MKVIVREVLCMKHIAHNVPSLSKVILNELRPDDTHEQSCGVQYFQQGDEVTIQIHRVL